MDPIQLHFGFILRISDAQAHSCRCTAGLYKSNIDVLFLQYLLIMVKMTNTISARGFLVQTGVFQKGSDF